MSWSIKASGQNKDDIAKFKQQIDLAHTAGIILFCSSSDEGRHISRDEVLPGSSDSVKIVGSCDSHGSASGFVNEKNVHYLFPGEHLSIMKSHFKGKKKRRDNEATLDQGSSASTALAAGLAALILWCGLVSGKEKFQKRHIDIIFNKLRTDQEMASLVDISGLMDDARAKAAPSQIITYFVGELEKLFHS